MDSPGPQQHTIGHVDCPACEALRRSVIMSGNLGKLCVREVWPLWLEQKQQTRAPKTIQIYREYYRALAPFFGEMLLKNIHIGNIVAYREQRKPTAGPGLINHEINMIAQMLQRAGLWSKIEKHYEALPIPKTGPGVALTKEEKNWLLEVASTGGPYNRWRVAYWAAVVSANTTCGPGELRMLRLKDLDLLNPVMPVINVVEGAKNKYRVRALPLNSDALWAMDQLVKLALEKGSYLPDHYLFPARARKKGEKPDPTKPMGPWKKAWLSLRREAAKRYPRLGTLRFYDLRHTALTEMLEDPNVPEQVIRDIAGHVSPKMIERYSHIRLARKKAALDALDRHRTSKPEPQPPEPRNPSLSKRHLN